MLDWLRAAFTRRVVAAVGSDRRVRIGEEAPSEHFVVSIALMIVFFLGLVALEIVHLIVLGEWNDAVFNGLMLIVGGLIGSLFGYEVS